MGKKDLDRPEYGSYEEVHEMLVQAMQEACMNDRSREYRSPNIDKSFLYEDNKSETKKKNRVSRFNKVAAIVIIALLGLNAMLLISDSSEVYSEKGLLHRIYEGARGIFTDEDPSEFVEMDETGKVYIINDMKDIDKAKAFWKDLCVPYYIPSEYNFIELEVANTMSGDYKACYKYYNGSDYLEIIIYSYEYADKVFSDDIENNINKNNRKIYLYYDEINRKDVADVYLDNIFICINGKLESEDLIDIVNNIK